MRRTTARAHRASIAWVVALAAVLSACNSVQKPASSPQERREGQTFAILINGGGRPRINFQSHLTHVRGFVDLLDEYGVARKNTVIFASDGSDPTEDLATREVNDIDDFWILPRGAQQALRPRIEYVDSKVEGYELQPARKVAIENWFVSNAWRFQADDTLFFYVTDHGEINKDDLTNNTIVLWKERLSVDELGEILDILPKGVRTVMLMSQCFSGSFAGITSAEKNICGYFASSADRPAYGCYPENRGVDGVGHSHHFLRGIEDLGSLSEAQSHVLVFDDSPDVPHTSSDAFLRGKLEAVAKGDGDKDLDETVDKYLEKAWLDRSRWEPEIRLLDRIGKAYGIYSPRSLKELETQISLLPKVSKELSTYAQRWQEAFNSVRQQNLRALLESNEAWSERLKPEVLKELTPEQRTELSVELVKELLPLAKSSGRIARMNTLRTRAEDAAAAAYRMEVRLGVLLRMHNQLTSIAGRTLIEEPGQEEAKASYEALTECEDLRLDDPAGASPLRRLTRAPGNWWQQLSQSEESVEDPEPFPHLADDQDLVDDVRPAWMGIRYRPPSKEERDGDKRSPGAVTVVTVYPESAAAKAGLQIGDVILGPPDNRFLEPNQVREWTMQREVGEPAPIDVDRDGEVIHLTLRPDPFPIDLPKLPGPPKVGATAPKVEVEAFRGDVTVHAGTKTMLFFWATWCAPCKFALPEVMRVAREEGVHVIAITDEKPKLLEKFFADFDEPFPADVAYDPFRQSFQAYGVSGTPTFVLIDGSGQVEYYNTGYNAQVGLALP